MAAIVAMIERDAPWGEILAQLLAVKGALRAFDRELWRTYLQDPNCGLRSRHQAIREQACQEVTALAPFAKPRD